MGNSAALKQLRLVASQGLPPHQAIPLMIDLLASIIPCAFANFCWLDDKGWPCDTYMPLAIPSVMDAFIGNYDRLVADPNEPSLDKYTALNVDVGARVIVEAPTFHRTIVYNEVFRALRFTDGLDLTVREHGRPRAIMFVNRDGAVGKWSSQEVALLRSTHSHFLAALDQPPDPAALCTDGSPLEDTAYLVAQPSGEIELASPNAPELLGQYLDTPIAAGFSYGRLLQLLPPPLMNLVNRLGSISAGRRSPAARDVRLTRWGEILARAYPATAPNEGRAPDGRAIIVLEKRLGRGTVVARNVGLLPLAPRERQLAFHVGMGVPFAEISRRLGLSTPTLRTYLKNIYDRTETAGRDHLVAVLTRQAAPSLH